MASIRRGNVEVTFDDEEWICVRFCFVKVGGPGGLVQGGAVPVAPMRELLEKSRELGTRPLNHDFQHGTGAANKQMFDLIQKRWKLRYLRINDGGEAVYEGSKKLADATDELKATIPKLADVPKFKSAFEKLVSAFEGAAPSETATVTL